ncbi:MAG: tetratricopeptide repeat protein [Terriglobales bacterium]
MNSSSSVTIATAKNSEASGTPPSSAFFHSPQSRTLLLSFLLMAAVLASYSPVIHNAFIYDDYGYIVNNPPVRAGVTWETAQWAFTTFDQGNWHPLTWLSHAFDCELFGLHPAGHHFINILLHAVNAVLLFLLLQSATGFRWRSLMVAALFALHPMNVESVAWSAERKNVLSMMFFLLALLAYGWYARRPGLRRYATVAGLFALALLSKPQVVSFPLLLLLWDYWPLDRVGAPAATARGWSKGWLILEKVPLLLLSAASAVVTMKAQRAGGAVLSLSHDSGLLRVETAVISYVRYLGKAFWPSKLVAMYPHPTKLYPVWEVAAAAVLLLLITTLVLRARQRRYLAVGWLWFLGSLVPMIGLVQVGVQAMADRYAYIPFIGVFLMVTWLVADWCQALRIAARWLAIPAVACLLALATLTFRQVGYWHDTESFWSRTVALTDDNYAAQVHLADFLLSHGRAEESAAHYRAALAVTPDGPSANLGLATYEDMRGNLPAAIERYEMVASRATDATLRAGAYTSLGFDYRGIGQLTKAKQCFETALGFAPNWARAMTGLGLIAQQNGDLPEAVRQYQRAIAVRPTAVGYLLLAQALRQEGHADEAQKILDGLAHSSPNLAEAQKAAELLLSGK